MPAARQPVAVKKSPAEKHEESMVRSLSELWDALQAIAENPKAQTPPKSIQKYNSFEWEDRTKGLGEQGTVLAMVGRVLVNQGFRPHTFDSEDLGHQYFNGKKKLAVSVSGGRLGIVVHAQAH